MYQRLRLRTVSLQRSENDRDRGEQSKRHLLDLKDGAAFSPKVEKSLDYEFLKKSERGEASLADQQGFAKVDLLLLSPVCCERGISNTSLSFFTHTYTLARARMRDHLSVHMSPRGEKGKKRKKVSCLRD